MILNILRDEIEYREVSYNTETNTKILLAPVMIKGLRVKGSLKVTHAEGGDSTNCTIVYRTQNKIPVGSKLNNREVMESVKINSFMPDAGYLNYVK